MPDETFLIRPARSMSCWLATSASAGASFSVLRSKLEKRIDDPQGAGARSAILSSFAQIFPDGVRESTRVAACFIRRSPMSVASLADPRTFPAARLGDPAHAQR